MGSLWGFWLKGLRGRHSFRPGTALRTGWGWRMKMKNRSVFKPYFFFSVSSEMTVVMWTTGWDITAKCMLGRVCISMVKGGSCLPLPASALPPQCTLFAPQKVQLTPQLLSAPGPEGMYFRAEAKLTYYSNLRSWGFFCMDVLGWVLDML